VRVAILGGTGKFGQALASRLTEAGDEVILGSRDEARAKEAAAPFGAVGARNEAAVGGVELVVLAVDAGAAVSTAQAVALFLGSTPLLSVASEVEFAGGTARPTTRHRSLAEDVAEVVDSPVAAGLHSLAAGSLARGRLDEDALVCGRDEAKALALELAGRLVSGRAIDVGPLQSARALEAMTAVILNVNRKYRTHAGLRVTGLD
jgi:8-hydroxy-5-deazaflavin:NADPH oxidoreductase